MHPEPSNWKKILPVPISVIIACGHATMSSDFARVLVEHTDIKILLACTTGKIAAAAIQQFIPDVALLDIEILDLNLLNILSSIAADGLKTKVVCLTASPSSHDLIEPIAMGVQGILFKGAARDDIADCVRDVFHGKNWFPAAPLNALPERGVRRRQSKPLIRALTAREHQIALLVCDGLSNRQLGQQLNLTEGTVKVHLHKIYRKLGVRNRAALSALAVASRASSKSRGGKRSEIFSQVT
jgi:two-component system nitrate/nitrite response regulator NarL